MLTSRQIELIVETLEIDIERYNKILKSEFLTKDSVTKGIVDKYKDKWLETIEALKILINELEDKSNRG